MDDASHQLIKRSNPAGLLAKLGHGLVMGLPIDIRILNVVGTFALVLVAGGIFVHDVHFLHELFPALPALVREFSVGLITGLMIAVFKSQDLN